MPAGPRQSRRTRLLLVVLLSSSGGKKTRVQLSQRVLLLRQRLPHPLSCRVVDAEGAPGVPLARATEEVRRVHCTVNDVGAADTETSAVIHTHIRKDGTFRGLEARMIYEDMGACLYGNRV